MSTKCASAAQPRQKPTCPVPLSEFDKSTGDYNEAVIMPADCYTNEEFFEFEKEAVFAKEWLCVGRVEQVPNPGDYYTITMIDEPLIVTRNKDSEVRVFSAVCRHRAMIVTAPAQVTQEDWMKPVEETSGNCQFFRCPYHWWTYNLDGKLMGAPGMEKTNGFENEDNNLPQLKVEIWKGFIFVNFDDDAKPLAPQLKAAEEAIENWHIENMVSEQPQVVKDIAFNWKVMAENFMEAYHGSRLHHGLHDWAPSENIHYVPFSDDSSAMVGTITTPEPDGGFNATEKATFPPVSTLSEIDHRRLPFIFIAPTLLLGMQVDSGMWFTLNPTSANTFTLQMGHMFPKETRKMKLFKELYQLYVQGVELFNNQDLPTNKAVQLGLKSRLAPRGRYSWQEEFCAAFNNWLIQRYKEAAEA